MARPFTIRTEQLVEVESLQQEQLQATVVRYVREHYPDSIAELGADVVEAMVEHAIQRAQRNGLFSGRAILFFVAMMFDVAPNFDEYRKVRAILRDRRQLSDSAKVRLIMEKMTAKDWHLAGEAYDENGWFA